MPTGGDSVSRPYKPPKFPCRRLEEVSAMRSGSLALSISKSAALYKSLHAPRFEPGSPLRDGQIIVPDDSWP